MFTADMVTVLKAWSGRMDASVSEFSLVEQEAAARVVNAVRAVLADRVAVDRFDHLESLREVGEPHIHTVLYSRGSERAEAVTRGA